MRTEFYYDSKGIGKIRALRWTPTESPVSVIQIIHGITEHIERYDQLARYLNSKGYLVVAEDHMGHGKSIDHGGTKGYFDGGWQAAIDDTLELLRQTREQYPELPYILLGHSMGSFMARTILCQNPELGLAGVILSGTGWIPTPVLKAGHWLVKAACSRVGERTPSRKLNNMIFGSFNAKVEHKRTTFDWLTRDSVTVDAYLADPMCGFVVSCGLLRDMSGALIGLQNPEQLAKMNRDLPVLFLSGGDDAVGGYGKGVQQTAEAFRNAGMKRVTGKIYPLCRHELHNEINRAEVFRYTDAWIRGILYEK